MRQIIKEFASIVSTTLPILEPVYEFGSFQVPDQMAFADLRPLFPNKEYVGCDMRNGPGVDKIMNLHAIDLPSESVGTVLCFDTLEHVEYPRKALEEIHRILLHIYLLYAIAGRYRCYHQTMISDHDRFSPSTF